MSIDSFFKNGLLLVLIVMGGISLGLSDRDFEDREHLIHNSALGRPRSLDTLDQNTRIRFICANHRIVDKVYLVAFVGGDNVPRLFDVGTNTLSKEIQEGDILLYTGKNFVPIPKR
ncbi:MAG: hypothetical protein RLZZ347_554 [Candidatus Parcubacteria bacterium]|jgi:hypothetical protein